VTTTPGSAWRGLAPYGEEDREELGGRDRDRDDVIRMITADGFRAGLLHGEAGVGKTSLLNAVLPVLRENGVVVVTCHDVMSPGESLAAGLAATGARATAGEAPSAFVSRIVGNAPPGQLYLFVLDDMDRALAGPNGLGDERITQELAEMFARSMARSSGRARFLYVCPSERAHLFSHLEKRTGSLFPPNCRHELGRLAPADAAVVLGDLLSSAGVSNDRGLADAVVGGIARGGAVLPADLQIALLGLRELRVTSTAQLTKTGGGGELARHWLEGAARSAGEERRGLRALAELGFAGPGGMPVARTAAEIGAPLAMGADEIERVMSGFAARGAVVRAGDSDRWRLAHEVLVPRVRELAAPARAAARRAHELLGAKAAAHERLSPRELWSVRSEGVAATSDEERRVLADSMRFYKMVAIGAAALPVAFLVLMFFMQSGRFYLDVAPKAGGERIVVREGRAGLSAFDWMGFGDAFVDTGLSRSMVDPKQWSAVKSQDIGGDKDGWDSTLDKVMDPRLSALVAYATSGDKKALEALRKRATDADDLAEVLVALRPIARGEPAEVEMIEAALATKDAPAVQQAAVAVAGAAANRNPEAYKDTLVRALTAPDPELRRIAFSAVRQLGSARSKPLYALALGREPDAAIRRELLLEVAGDEPDSGPPSADAAIPVLSDGDASPALRDRAKAQLRRAFASDAEAASTAAAQLVADENAPTDSRTFAIKLILEDGDIGSGGAPKLADPVRAAVGSKTEVVRAAALPLLARVAPSGALEDVTRISGERLGRAMKVAVALAWGELARAKIPEAGPALDKLIKDESFEVRAAAAEASGYLGRPAQEALIKMVKLERIEVAIGAARGLVRTADAGASPAVAVGGINELWKRKGRSRREAAIVYAAMAKKRPGVVMNYLVSSARNTEDPALHPIGVEGLCNAANEGNPEARRQLLRSTDDESAEVRRMVITCAADGPDPAKNGVPIATRLVKDRDGQIRAQAARVLALATAKGGKLSGGVAEALLALLEDPERDVRLIAIRAVSGLSDDAPKGAAQVLARSFERADEGEKIVLLRAGRAVGADDLVGMAIADGSPLVRVEAVDSALATGVRTGPTVSAALADADPQVRRAVLERLGTDKSKLEPATLERALALAVRDSDPGLRQLALTTVARVAPKEAVAARLGRSLTARAERERAQAAAAAIGLVERDAQLAVKLLTPLLDDPSHDVRVAMLASLGSAYAAVNSPDQLSALLQRSEGDAMKRLAAAAAFVMLARTDAGRAAATTALDKISKRGPTMARRTAKLVNGLIAGKAEGIAFLEQLVP
jgi:HEAT repeat protein